MYKVNCDVVLKWSIFFYWILKNYDLIKFFCSSNN